MTLRSQSRAFWRVKHTGFRWADLGSLGLVVTANRAFKTPPGSGQLLWASSPLTDSCCEHGDDNRPEFLPLENARIISDHVAGMR